MKTAADVYTRLNVSGSALPTGHLRKAGNILSGSFKCGHCQNHVVTYAWVSGVQNRNHCPYCLWSKHLDHQRPGDRLSACKSSMQPVALALKRAHKKYGNRRGELMLVHRCTGCGKIDLNRIAADDDAHTIWRVFEVSIACEAYLHELFCQGLEVIRRDETALVKARLFGI